MLRHVLWWKFTASSEDEAKQAELDSVEMCSLSRRNTVFFIEVEFPNVTRIFVPNSLIFKYTSKFEVLSLSVTPSSVYCESDKESKYIPGEERVILYRRHTEGLFASWAKNQSSFPTRIHGGQELFLPSTASRPARSPSSLLLPQTI